MSGQCYGLWTLLPMAVVVQPAPAPIPLIDAQVALACAGELSDPTANAPEATAPSSIPPASRERCAVGSGGFRCRKLNQFTGARGLSTARRGMFIRWTHVVEGVD